MRAWRTINASKSSHPQRRCLSSRYTFKRNCKAVFMEKSSIKARNGHLWPGAGLPVLTRRFPSSQVFSARLEPTGRKMRSFLTEQVRFANKSNVYLLRTAPTLVFACPCVSRLHSRNRRCERRKLGQRDKKTCGTTLSRKEVMPLWTKTRNFLRKWIWLCFCKAYC